MIQGLEWLEKGERNKGGNLGGAWSLHESSKAPLLALSGSEHNFNPVEMGGDTIVPNDLVPVESLPQDFASGGADISTPPKILSTDQDVQQPGFSRNNSAEATGFKQMTAEKVNNIDGLDVSISKQDVKQ